MIDVALQTSGPDVIPALNVFVSAIAALAAISVLWFTALKGPDISLVSSHLKLEYQTPPRADISLLRLEFNSIDLVFANNGSRSGALIQIFTSFKPSREFESFFWMEYVNSELSSDKSPDPTLHLPVIIPDRGTLVITLKIVLLLRSWKDAEKLTQIQGNIGEALKTIWNEGQALLNRFADLNLSIGTFEISVRRTKRKRLRTIISDKLVSKLEVPALPEWIREEAKKYLSKFDELNPPDYQAVLFIRTALDPIVADVSTNGKTLETTVLQGGLQQLSVTGWDRWFGVWRDQNDQTYRGVLTRNKILMEKITDYYQLAMKYNRRVTAVGTVERQTLETMRLEINKKADLLNTELQKYQKMILEATAHLLPVA